MVGQRPAGAHLLDRLRLHLRHLRVRSPVPILVRRKVSRDEDLSVVPRQVVTEVPLLVSVERFDEHQHLVRAEAKLESDRHLPEALEFPSPRQDCFVRSMTAPAGASAHQLEAELLGVPRLYLALREVGLRNRSVENRGVGGGT